MDLMISQFVWWLPVIILTIALRLATKSDPDWRWIGAGIVIFAIYSATVFWLPLIPGFPMIEAAQHNWTGKIAAILTTCALLATAIGAPGPITAKTVGLSWHQREGSLLPATLATAAMIGFVVLLQTIGGDGQPPSTETLIYQAIVPGIDEELLFRGLLFAVLAAAFARLERAGLWAAVAVTIVFTLGHSFFWSSDGASFDPIALVYVGVLGSLLMYIRMRTGSIVIPILAHNLTNVANQLA